MRNRNQSFNTLIVVGFLTLFLILWLKEDDERKTFYSFYTDSKFLLTICYSKAHPWHIVGTQ